jgi:hypothetical protein
VGEIDFEVQLVLNIWNALKFEIAQLFESRSEGVSYSWSPETMVCFALILDMPRVITLADPYFGGFLSC